MAENARSEPIHYKDIAEELGRDPASVSASLSIEKSQAELEGRPPYFERVSAGLYRYNELCEAAKADEKIDQDIRERAREANRWARSEVNEEISRLNSGEFLELAREILGAIRVRMDDVKERDHRVNGGIVLTGSWHDDGGEAPVVFYVKKCGLNEPIDDDTVHVIRGLLQTYNANQGVLISNGICTERAIDAAVNRHATVSPVHIMDKEIILNILFEGTKAVKSRRIEVYLKNDDFFEEIRMRASRMKEGSSES